MTTDKTALMAVSKARRASIDKRAQLRIEAAAWVESRMKETNAALDQAVMSALDEGHSVTSVAQAYTVSGKGPDRAAIYAIKAKYSNPQALWAGEYPFEWVGREIETAAGTRVVFDVKAVLNEFGPESVTGEFRWVYDSITHSLDAVITDEEPYPGTVKYYAQILERWLITHPYPGAE